MSFFRYPRPPPGGDKVIEEKTLMLAPDRLGSCTDSDADKLCDRKQTTSPLCLSVLPCKMGVIASTSHRIK